MQIDELRKKMVNTGHGPCVLMRWNYGTNVVADHFVPLSDVRLTCVLFDEDEKISLSVSAPYAKKQLGKMRIRMSDTSLVLVTDGARKGLNCREKDVRSNETFVKLDSVYHKQEDELSGNHLRTVASLVTSCSKLPETEVPIPKIYVITKKPAGLTPNWDTTLTNILGVTIADDNETRKQKFVDGLDKISINVRGGYIFDPKYVASGGMLCLSRLGAARQTGGPVYVIPKTVFDDYVQGHAWNLFSSLWSPLCWHI